MSAIFLLFTYFYPNVFLFQLSVNWQWQESKFGLSIHDHKLTWKKRAWIWPWISGHHMCLFFDHTVAGFTPNWLQRCESTTGPTLSDPQESQASKPYQSFFFFKCRHVFSNRQASQKNDNKLLRRKNFFYFFSCTWKDNKDGLSCL